MLIGKKIKEVREAQHMTLTQLSQKSGVQLATLSRMENLKMTGTLESHSQIAKALGISLTDLYQNIDLESPPVDMQSPATTTDVFVHGDKSSYEILTTKVLSKKMMPVLLTIQPKGKTTLEQGRPDEEKFVYVIEGQISVTVGQETYTLPTGHSLYFGASLKHDFENKEKTQAKVLCVSSPVML